MRMLFAKCYRRSKTFGSGQAPSLPGEARGSWLACSLRKRGMRRQQASVLMSRWARFRGGSNVALVQGVGELAGAIKIQQFITPRQCTGQVKKAFPPISLGRESPTSRLSRRRHPPARSTPILAPLYAHSQYSSEDSSPRQSQKSEVRAKQGMLKLLPPTLSVLASRDCIRVPPFSPSPFPSFRFPLANPSFPTSS
jgi:hypothetical protein